MWERKWICRALSLPKTLAQNLHLCLKKGSSELGLVSNTETFGGFPLRCFIRAARGSSAFAVAAILASGLGKITLLDELWGISGRLEAELRRLLWLREGGVVEFLERGELLLIPPPTVMLLVLMFVAEDEQAGSRDESPPLGAVKTELLDDVLGIEELDCWEPLCAVWERGPSTVWAEAPWPLRVAGNLTGSWWTGGVIKLCSWRWLATVGTQVDIGPWFKVGLVEWWLRAFCEAGCLFIRATWLRICSISCSWWICCCWRAINWSRIIGIAMVETPLPTAALTLCENWATATRVPCRVSRVTLVLGMA